MTIVDALDTLWIMDMKDEFQLGRDWVAESLNFDKNINISFFETVIRELGGLLSAYEFSKDKVFLDKAEILAEKLLKAFNTPYGIPYASVNLMSGNGASPGWTGGSSILSEIGTVQLEFLYLAYHTNNPKYAIAVPSPSFLLLLLLLLSLFSIPLILLLPIFFPFSYPFLINPFCVKQPLSLSPLPLLPFFPFLPLPLPFCATSFPPLSFFCRLFHFRILFLCFFSKLFLCLCYFVPVILPIFFTSLPWLILIEREVQPPNYLLPFPSSLFLLFVFRFSCQIEFLQNEFGWNIY